jgi:hypothetical protein
MDRYEGPHRALTIALPKGLYLAIIMHRHDGCTEFVTETIELVSNLA